MRKNTKKFAKVANKNTETLVEYLVSLGGVEIERRTSIDELFIKVDVCIVTPVGFWEIHLNGDWIATRFSSPTGGRVATSLWANPHSGKYNFHWFEETPEQFLNVFKQAIDGVMKAKPSKEQNAIIVKELSENMLRNQVYQAGYRELNRSLKKESTVTT